MNPHVTLLERCGVEVMPHHSGSFFVGDEYFLTPDQLKAYALEVGAKEAADYLNEQLKNTKWKEALHEQIGGCWMCETIGGGIAGPLLNNLELIRIATKAGWGKGEGL